MEELCSSLAAVADLDLLAEAAAAACSNPNVFLRSPE